MEHCPFKPGTECPANSCNLNQEIFFLYLKIATEKGLFLTTVATTMKINPLLVQKHLTSIINEAATNGVILTCVNEIKN